MSQVEIITASKADRVVQALGRADAAAWAESQIRLPGGQRFTFRRHVYQIEPMTLWHPRITVQKASQGGWTLLMMLKVLHGLITGRLPAGAIYLFPTDTKVSQFSSLRFAPLIDANPAAIGRYLHRTNNVHNRLVGTAALMLRGAQLTQRVGGVAAESAALRSDPADLAVYDERDLMPELSIGKARARLGHSDFKGEWDLSNPTIPHHGIAASFAASDQRHWMVRCSACNQWWCMEIEFPQILRRCADGRVMRACVKCGAELDIDLGEWVPKYPARSTDHVGYLWSRLNSHYEAPSAVLAAWEHPPEGNIADVVRYVLGRAYLDEEAGLTVDQVLLCCTDQPPASASGERTVMGVDVGRELHVVVGRRIGPDAYRIIALLLLDGWEALKLAAQAFHAQITCIDNEPELHAAQQYQAAGPGEIWLSDYGESILPYQYDTKIRLVRANRTAILDETHYVIRTAGKLRLPTPTALVRQFAAHCAAMSKLVEKDTLTGRTRAVYLSTGPDHFRHAFVNFLLAAKRQVPILEQSTTATDRARRTEWDLY